MQRRMQRLMSLRVLLYERSALEEPSRVSDLAELGIPQNPVKQA